MYHWSFYYDAAKLLHEDNNCIIIASNWMAWWNFNICFCA